MAKKSKGGGMVERILVSLAASIAAASVVAAEPSALRTGAAAYGDWRDDAPGVWRRISPQDLPRPLASEPKAERSQLAPRPEGARPKTLDGFEVETVAEGLAGPRVLRFAPNGDLFVAESAAGRVRAIRFVDGKAVRSDIFVSGLDRPYGLAFYPPGPNPRFLYVGATSKVVRLPYRTGETTASGPAETIAAPLPAGDSGHWTRDIVFSRDGETLFVAVGSKSNVADGHVRPTPAQVAELEAQNGVGAGFGPEFERADILAFDPDGGNRRVYATGLRNCSGLRRRPNSDELWCVVNERDMLGDDLPPDYATHVTPGAFYGWPWYYIGANEDPRHAGARPDLAGKITTPDVLLQPHSAPLGLAFYEGGAFGADFEGDAFIALHGSWNRAKRTGYKVARLKFAAGKPTGAYQDFVTGFVIDETRVWGRPVDVAVAPDGALFISEDGAGTIFRVSKRP
jgi:glucose/arabinose dehydrogenase